MYFDLRDIDNGVDNGIDCKTADRMNVELAGDVFAMGQHRVHADIQLVGNLLVGQAADNTTCLLYTSDAADE